MFLADLVLVTADIDIVVAVVPGGNAMPPPKLSADAPVLNVVHPLVVGLGPVFRHEFDFAGLDRFDRRPGQRFDVHIPLIGQVRLDDRSTSVAPWYFGFVVFDLVQQAERVEVLDDFLSSDKAVKPAIGLRDRVIDRGVIVKNIVLGQIVTLADFIIIEIVCRRDLDATSAELGIDIFVGDDRHLSFDQRQQDLFANQVLVSLVFGMNRNRAVAQHCFGPGGRHDQVAIS